MYLQSCSIVSLAMLKIQHWKASRANKEDLYASY